MDEIAELTPHWRGVSHERLGKQGLQWPVPTKAHPGTAVLSPERFATARGRANLFAVHSEPPAERAAARPPLIPPTGPQPRSAPRPLP